MATRTGTDALLSPRGSPFHSARMQFAPLLYLQDTQYCFVRLSIREVVRVSDAARIESSWPIQAVDDPGSLDGSDLRTGQLALCTQQVALEPLTATRRPGSPSVDARDRVWS